MKPYYDHAGITIYHGDSRDILPNIQADVLVTDPPYGVGLGVTTKGAGGKHGFLHEEYKSYEDTYENHISIVVPILRLAVAQTKRGAVFTGPHITDMPRAEAFGGIYCKAASGRHCWGFKTFLPFLLYGKDPELNRGARPLVLESTETADKNGHPCPKPLGWMKWLIQRVSMEGESILDPFMGSGTTLVAAKQLGRKAIGIEIELKYCDIAIKRLEQECLDLSIEQDSRGASSPGKSSPSSGDMRNTGQLSLIDGEHRTGI
jgi:site-specific DNA-methyltransferase (adenine-specific)